MLELSLSESQKPGGLRKSHSSVKLGQPTNTTNGLDSLAGLLRLVQGSQQTLFHQATPQHGLQNLQIFRPDMGTAVTGHTAPAGALPAITAPPATFEQKEAKAVMPIENGVVVESQPVENAVKKDEMELSPEEQASKMLAAFTKRAADKKDADGKSETTTPKARGRPKGTGRKAKAKAKAKAMAKKNKSDKDETKKKQVKKNDVKKGSAKQGSAKKKDTKKSEKGVEVHDREYWRSMGKEARKVHRPHGCYKCRWSPGCSPSCFG